MITLKNVLLVNGISSGVTGVGLVVFAPSVAAITGLDNSLVWYSVGIFLVAFALFVLSTAMRPAPTYSRVRIITALDTSWVIGSLIVITSPIEFTMIGRIAIILVALWVALMALLQYRGLRTLTS
jgi:hypothetical protein